MKSKIIQVGILAAALCGAISAGAGEVKPGEKSGKEARLEARAKLSEADAEKIALAKVPGGKVKEGEIEKEDGKLIWSFDITTPDSRDITEVNVDSTTGAVVSVEKEGAKDEKAEKDSEEKGNKETGHHDKDGSKK